MKITRYNDPAVFCDAVYPALIRHEAQNTIPLGNVLLGKDGGEPHGWRNPAKWYMAAVHDAAGVVMLTAVMTPPMAITLYETDNRPNNEALTCLCENLIGEEVTVPGVLTECGLAERFAEIYSGKRNMGYAVKSNQRIYTLTRVAPDIPQIGTMRPAKESDLYFLPYWELDCGFGAADLATALTNMERRVKKQSLVLLEDEGNPVSMAAISRELPTGKCVGMVYTPPRFRGKGYASSCVAQLSKLILESGADYAVLFTDLANPTSNSIYQKIGYKPICDYVNMTFTR